MRGPKSRRPGPNEAGRVEDPAAAPEGDAAGDVIRVEEEVVRDLRHSIGNHFHKLYYWADRMGSETDSAARAGQAEELERAIQRLQDYIELALRYFERLSTL